MPLGTDMLTERMAAYPEFFGFPGTTPDTPRALARLE